MTSRDKDTMFKAVILLTRRPDDTHEQFAAWWLTEHAPLVQRLPGIRRAIFNVVADDGPVDGISELWFDDRSAFDAAYASELGIEVVENSLAHVGERRPLFVEEYPLIPNSGELEHSTTSAEVPQTSR